MRNVNANILSGVDYLTQTGGKVDSNQLVSASFQISFGDSSAAGTFKLQASNDINNDRYQPDTFTPTNWTDIPNTSAAITGGSSALLTVANMAYRWVRAIYTPTAAGVQTVAPIADTGVKQVQTVTAVADTGVKEVTNVTTVADVAGSLNSTYFTFATANNAVLYYVWYNVDAGGVDPAPPGRTGIEVPIVTLDTADTVASATRSAITGASIAVTVTGATDHVIITNNLTGIATDAANGTASPGFSYAITQGVASNLNSKYFTLSSVNVATKVQKNFYMWYNVNSQGVDPAVAGRTAIPIVVAAGASGTTIATAMRTALNALTNDFVATGANAIVIITDVAAGLVTAAADGTAATGFTFANTTPGIASNLNNKYFYLNSALAASVPTDYFVWINVDAIGTAPVVAGRTAVPVAISAGDSAATIGTAIAGAIDALSNFTASGTTTVTVTNTDQGQFTPMSDAGSTGFTFAVTAGGSTTVAVNINALSI